MRDSKQNLMDRWTTEEGKSLLKEIVVRLTKAKSLEDLKGLNRVEDKFDLRGISFPKEYSEYDYKGKHMKQVVGSLKFKGVTVDNIDFSYADIQHTEWKNCRFSSVKFYGAQLEQLNIINCDFENVSFENTRLSYSYLNIRSGTRSGSFKDVIFRNSQLNETRFSFPTIENCVFDSCNLYAADFDGSRFTNSKFIGEVNSSWFRKHSIKEFEPNFILNQVNKKKFANEMKDVDFLEAILKYVTFSKDLDLSTCKFGPGTKFELMEKFEKDIYAMSA
jgi:uncharacterized protein YjbI with pentapeptide repeats